MLAFLDLRPFFFVGGLPVVALLAWAARRLVARRWSYAATLAVATVAHTALFWFLLAGSFVGQRRELTFAMIRTPSDGSNGGPADPDVVTLTFRDYPDQFLAVESAGLARTLDQQESSEVEAVIEVVLDYGRTRGIRLERVGDMDVAGLDGSWGRVGNGTSSPFP